MYIMNLKVKQMRNAKKIINKNVQNAIFEFKKNVE